MNWTLAGSPVSDLEYTYDKDGHVIAKSGSFASVQLPAAVTGNTFNADNEMTSFNGTTMTYDADGNLTSDGTNSYFWDARGHLVALAGTNVAAYQYDAFGRRVQNTLNGVMTQYLYDGQNPVEELDGASPANVTATMLTGLGIDQYFARTDSNGTMSYLTNRLGSTIALANSSGAITTQYTYDPFGNTTISGSSTNPFQFTGRENDGTGLYYYRARYYSPAFQRFISQDPFGLGGGGMNLYSYASNDPSDLIDPQGTQVGEVSGPIIIGGGIELAEFCQANPALCKNIAYGAATLGGDVLLGPALDRLAEPPSCDDGEPKKCKPCDPPEGTIGWRYDTTHSHYPIMGPHYHLFEMHQNKLTCECFWNKLKNVVDTPPPNSVPMPPGGTPTGGGFE